jgi:hypothetical protein
MMTYTLSPEQKVVSEALLANAPAEVKFFDLATAFLPIYNVITTLLEEDKHVLIHIPPHSELSSDILRLIETYRLDSLSIDVGNRNPIPESDIFNLRSILKKEIDTTPIINHLLNTQKLTNDLSHPKKYYEALDRKIHTDRTFRDFVAALISKNDIKPTAINLSEITIDLDLDLSGQEYYNIKRSINKAASSYKKEFDLLDKLGIISEEIWSLSEDEFINTKETLKKLNQQAKSLFKKYKLTYTALKESISKDVTSQMDSITYEIELHQKECIAAYINETYRKNEKSSGFSLFNKKTKPKLNGGYIEAFDKISSMIHKISKEWYDELPAPTSEDIDYAFIEKFLADCKANVSNHTNKLHHNLIKSIHRINRINTSSEAVKLLDEELTQLITELDAVQFIQQKFNSNSISFIKQMEMCQNIASSIDRCDSLLSHNTLYTDWKRTQTANTHMSNVLIQELKTLPVEHWSEQYDLWYNQQISNTVLNHNKIDPSIIEGLRTLNNKITENEIAALTNKLQSKRIRSAEDLKSTSKDLYNTLFKKKGLPSISWSELIPSTISFIQDFFPLHISNNLDNAAQYDNVISFSRRNEERNQQGHIHYISPILQSDIDDMSQSKNHFLYLNTYNYNVPITELSNSEKLKAAKKLAKFLLSLNQQIKIYQLKTGNIISLLPPADGRLLEANLDKHGVKNIDVTESLYDKLTESILFTERQPYLLIKDELINPEMHQHLIWQAEIIQIFKTAGYKILSLNTDRQLINNDTEMNNLIDVLTDHGIQNPTPIIQEDDVATYDTSNTANA